MGYGVYRRRPDRRPRRQWLPTNPPVAVALTSTGQPALITVSGSAALGFVRPLTSTGQGLAVTVGGSAGLAAARALRSTAAPVTILVGGAGPLRVARALVSVAGPSLIVIGGTAHLSGTRALTSTGQPATIVIGGTGHLTSTVTFLPVAPSTFIVTYELVVVARTPQPTGPPVLAEVDAVNWTGLSYTDELSRPQTLSAGCKVSTLPESVLSRLRQMRDLPSELWLYRNSRKVFAGPLLGWQVQGDALSLQARGLLHYLRYWLVTTDLTFTNVDQFTIGAQLVDHWQGLDYGHFGIDTSEVGLSGFTRDAAYLANELHNVGQRIGELGGRRNGFDAEVDPASRKLRFWHPTQGIDRSSEIIFDARSIASPNVQMSVAPGDLASEVLATGTGPEQAALYAVATNDAVRVTFGRVGLSANFDLVSVQGTLDDHAQGLLDSVDDALFYPGPDLAVFPDTDLSSYGVGDRVGYSYDAQLGLQTGTFRVAKRAVTVAGSGRERVAVEFV